MTESVRWSSSAIPVKPGITMSVRMWMKADGLKPVKKNRCVYVAVKFLDECGFKTAVTHLLGGGMWQDLCRGSYGWTEVKGSVAAPEKTCWMTVELGLAPSQGTAYFDDIHIALVDPPPPVLKR